MVPDSMPEAMTGSETSALREIARSLALEGLRAVTPESLLRKAVSLADGVLHVSFLDDSPTATLALKGKLIMVAVGKAAAPLAAELHRLLGARIDGGLVVTKEGFALPGLPFPQRECGHPVPDSRGIDAARETEALLSGLSKDDVVLVLVSGGASALLPAPVAGITLADKQALAGLMLRTEMDIHQINRVRKAVSRFKGGGLAALAAPARTVGMYLSDVPGDDLASIGSGPTVPEAVDAPAVMALLREKNIWEETPPAIRGVLEAGGAPKPPPPTPPLNGLIGANRHLLHAMAEAARQAGFVTQVAEAPATGLNAAALFGLLARWEAFARGHGGEPVCLISGGETLVEVTGQGMGGRCQELAAMMMPRLEDGAVFLAAGSDGNDGPTDAAGGVVDDESWGRVQEGGIPHAELLADNDSYHLLELTGNLIKVPPTRNNVMDVHMFLRAG